MQRCDEITISINMYCLINQQGLFVKLDLEKRVKDRMQGPCLKRLWHFQGVFQRLFRLSRTDKGCEGISCVGSFKRLQHNQHVTDGLIRMSPPRCGSAGRQHYRATLLGSMPPQPTTVPPQPWVLRATLLNCVFGVSFYLHHTASAWVRATFQDDVYTRQMLRKGSWCKHSVTTLLLWVGCGVEHHGK